MRTGFWRSAVALCVLLSPALSSALTAAEPPEHDGSLEEVVVTGSKYRGEIASSGARIDVPTRDLPLSISVLNADLIDDRQVRNLRELADNVAGVRSRASGSGAFTIDYTIRGLQGTNGSSIAVNGFRFENFSAGFDPQAVERVEFLKGPASVLYGASGALGGLVNIVTKTPRTGNFLVAEITGGYPTYGRVTVDGNTTLGDSLDVRLNGAATHQDVINTFRNVDEKFLSPVLRWRPLENVSVLLEGSYFDSKQPTRGSQSYPAYERFVDLPKDFKTGDAFDIARLGGYNYRGDVTWEIVPGLTFRQGVNYQGYVEDENGSTVDYPVFAGPDLLNRALRRSLSYIHGTTSQSELRWTVNWGPTRHVLLGGFEYADRFFGGFCCDGAPLTPLNLDDPHYGSVVPTVPLTELFGNTILSKAWYLQDFIDVGRVKVLLGMRSDNVDATSYWCTTTTPGCSVGGDPVVTNLGSAADSAVSPRIGVAWQPDDANTLFVSWSKSFNPNTSLDRNGNLLPPERGIQYEAGIRRELADQPGRLTATAAVFQITRENIADCDPLFPDCGRSIAIGEQRVRGFELELAGKPLDWLDILGSYGYLDAKVTKSDEAVSGIAVGSALPEAVPHTASLLTTAALVPLGLPDFSVSLGLYYSSKRPGRTYFNGDSGDPLAVNLSELPAYFRVDLGAFWTVNEHLRLQANITNLFDEKILEPVNVGFNRAQTFKATAGLRYRF